MKEERKAWPVCWSAAAQQPVQGFVKGPEHTHRWSALQVRQNREHAGHAEEYSVSGHQGGGPKRTGLHETSQAMDHGPYLLGRHVGRGGRGVKQLSMRQRLLAAFLVKVLFDIAEGHEAYGGSEQNSQGGVVLEPDWHRHSARDFYESIQNSN